MLGTGEGNTVDSDFSLAGDVRRSLTERDCAILRLIACGWTDKAIAVELDLSRRTVSNRVGDILVKLCTASRTEAAVLAICAGWIVYAPPGYSSAAGPPPGRQHQQTDGRCCNSE